jgi:hypothetical protein
VRFSSPADQTEIIWFDSHTNLAKLAVCDRLLCFGTKIITPATVVRDLGVWLDAELSMKQLVTMVAAACFQNLGRLRRIRRRVDTEIPAQLVLALITSRLDYCNSILAGLPLTIIQLLQRVQNAAARQISLDYREHVTPALIQLHWLPAHSRIQCNTSTHMRAVHTGGSPAYIASAVQAVAVRTTRSWQLSFGGMCSVTPKLRTKFGKRACSFSGPCARNSALNNRCMGFQKATKNFFLKLLILCGCIVYCCIFFLVTVVMHLNTYDLFSNRCLIKAYWLRWEV